MTKAMLDNFLTNTIPRASLFYGENEFLVSYYADMIVKKTKSTPHRMYFEEYNHEEVLNFLGSNSLFGDTSVLALKLYKALNKKQIQEIFATLAHNTQSFLVIELLKSPSITDTEYAKRFKVMAALFKPTKEVKDIVEVRFFQLSRDEAIKILYNRSRDLSLQLDSNLLQLLLDVQHNDLAIAYNELSKFVYYEKITPELIQDLSYNLGDVKIESLLECLFDKRGHLLATMQILHDEGIDNMELLRDLGRYFYILFKLHGHSKTHGTMDAKEALGYKPPNFHILSRRSLKITTEKYLLLFTLINKWRVQQMQGKNVAMQYLIAIQQIL